MMFFSIMTYFHVYAYRFSSGGIFSSLMTSLFKGVGVINNLNIEGVIISQFIPSIFFLAFSVGIFWTSKCISFVLNV